MVLIAGFTPEMASGEYIAPHQGAEHPFGLGVGGKRGGKCRVNLRQQGGDEQKITGSGFELGKQLAGKVVE